MEPDGDATLGPSGSARRRRPAAGHGPDQVGQLDGPVAATEDAQLDAVGLEPRRPAMAAEHPEQPEVEPDVGRLQPRGPSCPAASRSAGRSGESRPSGRRRRPRATRGGRSATRAGPRSVQRAQPSARPGRRGARATGGAEPARRESARTGAIGEMPWESVPLPHARSPPFDSVPVPPDRADHTPGLRSRQGQSHQKRGRSPISPAASGGRQPAVRSSGGGREDSGLTPAARPGTALGTDAYRSAAAGPRSGASRQRATKPSQSAASFRGTKPSSRCRRRPPSRAAAAAGST